MLKLFDTWLESMRFACEMQSVISMRMMHLAQGGPHAAAEASRMIAEKIDTFAEAETVLVNALSRGEGFLIAAERSYTSVRRRVRANSRRLSGSLSPADGIPETPQ